MKSFADAIIKPFVVERGYRTFCEIGASLGENTAKLLETEPALVAVIDPCLDADLVERFRPLRNVVVRRGLSLEVLPTLKEPFDCILIDGDHNWYTVYHELKLIQEHALLRQGGAIFLHDVAWPYGRRDMYYQPNLIPSDFIQPYAKKGIVRGESRLADLGGINNQLSNALTEGGPRNGVLTAIEDFRIRHPNRYLYLSINRQVGLGLLFKGTGLWARLSLAKWFVRFRYPGAGLG
jgi:hypothetical protein